MYTRAIDPKNWGRIFMKFASLGECRLLGRTPTHSQFISGLCVNLCLFMEMVQFDKHISAHFRLL